MIWVLAAGLIFGPDDLPRQPPIETLSPPMIEQGLDLDEAGAFVDRGVIEGIGAYWPTTAFLIDGDNRLTGLSVAFTRAWIGQGERRRTILQARLRARQGTRTVEAVVEQETCPQIAVALTRLEALTPLRINSPYVGPDDDWNPSVMLDGYGYTLATQARFEGAETDYRTVIESVEGSPISAAIIDAAIELAPCWTAAD